VVPQHNQIPCEPQSDSTDINRYEKTALYIMISRFMRYDTFGIESGEVPVGQVFSFIYNDIVKYENTVQIQNYGIVARYFLTA